jgi:small ligand-binding sensory domain FIST
MGPQDRAMVDAFLSLPEPQRKPVRELVTALVTALARAAQAGGQVWRRIAAAPAMR